MRLELPGHDVRTVAHMGWSGISNGKLLSLAAAEGFDAIITNDRGLEYEQNLSSLPLTVVVLLSRSNTIASIRSLYGRLSEALTSAAPGDFIKITE